MNVGLIPFYVRACTFCDEELRDGRAVITDVRRDERVVARVATCDREECVRRAEAFPQHTGILGMTGAP